MAESGATTEPKGQATPEKKDVIIRNSYDKVADADFLPKKPHSWEQLRVAVRSNLDATLGLIVPLPIQDLGLPQLETVGVGTYTLESRPSVDFMRELPNFRNGSAEIGLFCVNGKWLIKINEGMETTLPDNLRAIQRDGIFQADIHSHPGVDPGSTQPSDEDLDHLSSTIDGKHYLISNSGMVEYQKPATLPGGYANSYHRRAWEYWIREEIKLTEEEYNKRGGWKLKREFYEKFFGLRLIPWENEEEIERLLAEKEALHVVENRKQVLT